MQIASVLTSVLSITWALVSFRRFNRLDNGNTTSIPGLLMEFLWHLFAISARVLALVVFAVQFKLWLLVIFGVHYMIIINLQMKYGLMDLSYLGDECVPRCFVRATAFTNTLCVFLISSSSKSRIRYVTLHSIMYAENIVMAVLWYTSTLTQELWYSIPFMVIILLGYLIGVIFQIVSYKICHHNSERIDCCVSCNELEFEDTV